MNGRSAVVWMHEFHERVRLKAVDRPAERARPRRVQRAEVPVEPCGAQHVEGQGEEAIGAELNARGHQTSRMGVWRVVALETRPGAYGTSASEPFVTRRRLW